MDHGNELVNSCLSAIQAGNWYLAGNLLSKLESGPFMPEGETSWLGFMMKNSKANRNTLRMMQRSVKFVDSHHDEQIQSQLISSGLSHVDVLMRAIEVDAKKGAALMNGFLTASRPQSYRQLTREYEKIRASSVSLQEGQVRRTRESSGAFRKVCLDFMASETMVSLYGQICTKPPLGIYPRVWKGAHPLTSPYATIRRAADVCTQWESQWAYDPNGPASLIDGFECFMRYADDDYDVVRRRLLQTASEATLYDLFWVFVPTIGFSKNVFALDDENPFEETDFYVSLFKKMAVPNLGLIIIDPTRTSLQRVLLPSGPPSPDRRHLWNKSTRDYLA